MHDNMMTLRLKKKVIGIESVVTQITSSNTFCFLSISNHKLFGTFTSE